jgi:hypothetical protein
MPSCARSATKAETPVSRSSSPGGQNLRDLRACLGQQGEKRCQSVVDAVDESSPARQGERLVAETADPVLRLKRALALDAHAGTNGVAERVHTVTRSSSDWPVRFPE